MKRIGALVFDNGKLLFKDGPHGWSLHSRTLCVMSGNTTMNYSHSVPKGQVHLECEQMILFFRWNSFKQSTTSDSELSSASSANPGSSTNGGETSTADEQSESEVESVRGKLTYPSLLTISRSPKYLSQRPPLNKLSRLRTLGTLKN